MAPRILLLDDEPDLLQALSIRLTAAGFQCETAMDGKEGLDKLRAEKPDVILTDLLMPRMDGYEFIQQLRANDQTSSIPIIVLTAMPKPMVDRRANELIGVQMLFKPIEFEQLLLLIHNLLGVRHG